MSDQITINIDKIINRRIASLEALNRYYAALVLQYFRSVQPPSIGQKGEFWENQTGQAALRVFSTAFREGYDMGFLIAHGVDYGVYLEYANNRQNAALWPIIKRFAGRYFQDVKRIWSD